MLRPRESRDLQLIASQLTLEPTAAMDWSQDVFGNSAATAHYQVQTDRLAIVADSEIELLAATWPNGPIWALWPLDSILIPPINSATGPWLL